MAKDAKGHGSEGRGGSMSVFDKHQHAIALDTVKNPLKGTFLGGPSAAEAETMLRGKFGYSDSQISSLKGRGGNPTGDASPMSRAYQAKLGKAQGLGKSPTNSGEAHIAAIAAAHGIPMAKREK